MTTSPLPLDVGPLVAAVRAAPPRALASVLEALQAADSEAAPATVRTDLAALLGLDVTIRLADMLAGRVPDRPTTPSVATEAKFVGARLEGRLLSLEARLDELVNDPESSPFALPSEALLWNELARGLQRAEMEAVKGERQPGWSEKVARLVMTPYRIFVRSSWNDVRHTLDGMQREVTREVRNLGPRALHFYRIHRILVDTTKPQVDQVTEQLMRLEEQTFIAALTAAIEKIPARPTRELTRPWRDRGGLIPTHLRRALAVVRTAFVVERDTLMAFLRALPDDLRPVDNFEPFVVPNGDDAAPDDVAADEVATDEGAADEIATDDVAADEGAADEVAADDLSALDDAAARADEGTAAEGEGANESADAAKATEPAPDEDAESTSNSSTEDSSFASSPDDATPRAPGVQP